MNPNSAPDESDIGYLGESLAVEHLTAMGYVVIDRRYKIRGGEIDIVARMDTTLAFVEVKTVDLRHRKQSPFGDPETWITPRKKKFMAAAARHYLWKKAITDMDIRFDVITIRLFSGRNEINHLPDAFRT